MVAGAEIEVDYLVVGAGASGMAFVDALVGAGADAEILLVDRRHRPGDRRRARGRIRPEASACSGQQP